MFTKTKSKTKTAAPAELELWVPGRLAADYDDALARVSASVTPLSHRTWADELEPGLSTHLARALAATRYAQTPPAGRVQFEAEVRAAVAEVFADSGRAWDAFLHLRALDAAETTVSDREKDERARKAREAAETCAVCGEFDPSAARGSRVSRYLDTGAFVRMSIAVAGVVVPDRNNAVIVAGHAECVAEVLRQHAERTAAERLNDGRTRKEAASDWLDRNNNGPRPR